MAYTRHGRYIAGERDLEFERQARRVCPPNCFPCKNEADTYFYRRTKEQGMSEQKKITAVGGRVENVITGGNFKTPVVMAGFVGNYNAAPEPSIRPFQHGYGDYNAEVVRPIPSNNLPAAAIRATQMAYNKRQMNNPDAPILNQEDTYVVWFVKTLTDWLSMTSTTFDDGFYYEASFNGSTDLVTVHQYQKINQRVIEGEHFLVKYPNGMDAFLRFSREEVSRFSNHLQYPTQLPTQPDDWYSTLESRSFHNRKVVLRSQFTAQEMFEVTYDHGRNKIYVDAYKLVCSSVFPKAKVII